MLLFFMAPAYAALPAQPGVGIDERLGERAALDSQFVNESGETVTIGELMDRPTIIAPVYLNCRDVCPMLLAGVADVAGKLDEGIDYQILAVSFDEQDTPQVAREAKRNYLQAVHGPFPPERWTFLTGNRENIHALMDSIGFRFLRQDNGAFSHTAVLVALAPDGKIVRYLYGVTFLPFDVSMALTEASEGRVGSMGRKVLLYCFSYDPEGRGYVFNILKVTATVTLLFAGSFFVYLVVSTRKRRKHFDR